MLFRGTFFSGITNFRYVTAEGYLRFERIKLANDFSFDFWEAAFENASRVSFHGMELRPSWFLNVDSRKIVFTDVKWRNLDGDFWNTNIKSELSEITKRLSSEPVKRMFEITARQLAVNAEENNRYDDASKLRYIAMETRRLEMRGKLDPSNLITWLYKWTSGYGESFSWAAFVLVLLLGFFALSYNSPFASFKASEKEPVAGVVSSQDSTIRMNNSDGFVYSLMVATFQKPEPKPTDNLTSFFIFLETVLVPLQAALLVLAIRRKFMR